VDVCRLDVYNPRIADSPDTSAAPARRPSRGARRRTPRKGDLTEQAILDTAERLLAERPLSEIPIDELARGAGISRPSFYFYFESREAILRALSERMSEELYSSSRVWLRRVHESTADAIRRALEANVVLWREHGPVLRATLQASERDPEMRRFWDDVWRRFVDATAEQIERERAAGLAPSTPAARSLASVLITMNHQSFYQASLSRHPAKTYRELVDVLVTVWLRSVYGAD
jgi:TetR/AcrR family transcriptional regulator, ethionamide resistance regulator